VRLFVFSALPPQLSPFWVRCATFVEVIYAVIYDIEVAQRRKTLRELLRFCLRDHTVHAVFTTFVEVSTFRLLKPEYPDRLNQALCSHDSKTLKTQMFCL
jgi:hypothetical protein